MGSKLAKVRALMAQGKEYEALAIVARFGRLGDDAAVIQRGFQAVQNPAFFESLGFTPNDCFRAAIDAIRRKYNISPPAPAADAPAFAFVSPHTARRTDGRAVAVTVPVEFPETVESGGLLYRFQRQGYRTADGKPAGYYVADEGSELWLCEGKGYVAE